MDTTGAIHAQYLDLYARSASIAACGRLGEPRASQTVGYCDTDGDPRGPLFAYSAQYIDAVLTFARAADALYHSGPLDPNELYSHIRQNATGEGVSGPIILDPYSADRLGSCDILNLKVRETAVGSEKVQQQHGRQAAVALTTLEAGFVTVGTYSSANQIVLRDTIRYPGGGSNPPADGSPESVPPSTVMRDVLIAIVSSLVLVILLICFIIVAKKQRKTAARKREEAEEAEKKAAKDIFDKEVKDELERRRKNEDTCTFYFVEAEYLMTLEAKKGLPVFSELKADDKLVEISLPRIVGYPINEHWPDKADTRMSDYANRESVWVLSHRWEEPGNPDPEGLQLEVIQKELIKRKEEGKAMTYVWFDYGCLPQGERTQKEEVIQFRWGLEHANVLYLLFPVLILLDNNYYSRFWCLFESWLSFQEIVQDGLRPAEESQRRCTIKQMHNANQFLHKALEEMWRKERAIDAYKMLKKDDVFVTNKSDKQAQLPKILKLGHIEEESIVDMRTTTRINDKGEPVKECKVRFKGYGQADDEWIPDKYVKKALKTAWNDEAFCGQLNRSVYWYAFSGYLSIAGRTRGIRGSVFRMLRGSCQSQKQAQRGVR